MEKIKEYRICKCKDWKENIGKLNSGFAMSVIHGMVGYTGKQFIFCPWCGEKLIKEG